MGLGEVQINIRSGLGFKFMSCVRLNSQVTQATKCPKSGKWVSHQIIFQKEIGTLK